MTTIGPNSVLISTLGNASAAGLRLGATASAGRAVTNSKAISKPHSLKIKPPALDRSSPPETKELAHSSPRRGRHHDCRRGGHVRDPARAAPVHCGRRAVLPAHGSALAALRGVLGVAL